MRGLYLRVLCAETQDTVNLIDQLFCASEPAWFETGGGREGTFEAFATSDGTRVPVIGTSIARRGLAFVSTVAVRGPEIPLSFACGKRTIACRVRIVKDDVVQGPKRAVHRYYSAFTAIAPEDWAAVVAYAEDRPDPSALRGARATDEDYRSLTPRIQIEIIQQLVRLKRLGAPGNGLAPLIRMQPTPARGIGDGRTVRDVRIDSRINLGGEARSYYTRFRIFSDERVELLG